MRLKAITALVMMVLFYAVAAGAIVGLFWVATELGNFTIAHLRGRAAVLAGFLVVTMYIGGFVVSYSLLPRLDRFKPPGPELDEKSHPRLFREIERIAAA